MSDYDNTKCEVDGKVKLKPYIRNEGNKFDSNKLRYDLLPVDALEDVIRILTNGAKKYGDRNWEKGMSWGRLFAAALRHLFAFWMGENDDSEWNISHLAHAATNILFLLTYQKRKIGTDDRVKVKGE